MPTDDNREIARRFVEEVWGRGDLDIAREIVDKHVVHHRQRAGERFGIDGLLQGVTMYETAYPERTFTQDAVLVDGNLVQDRWTMQAVHSGELLGVPPTGRQVRLHGQNRYLIEDGKIVEVWHDEDIYGMMRQIGWSPPPPEAGWPHWPPSPAARYRLAGPQVEPDAALWTVEPCPVPSVIRVADLQRRTDDEGDPWYFPPYPGRAETENEIEELLELASLRDDQAALNGGSGQLRRLAVSPFLLLRPPPLGAVYRLSGTEDTPLVSTGRELARWFENETPGLSHRHAANYLLSDSRWSPPRQARVWMALDVAIYSAMLAAWHYKWAAERSDVSFRPRPVEVDYRVSVLYNRAPNANRDADGSRRTQPVPSPGTPRHPAYPSGHSTVGGAASEILSYFFPDFTTEFDQLADNCGMARLWAGIHYRSDHVQGMALGRSVARMVIGQLERGGVSVEPEQMPDRPPSRSELRRRAQELSQTCAALAVHDRERRPPSQAG